MAKTQKKKSNSGTTNPDGRKNGKAWKKNKNKPAPVKTEARQQRDMQILRAREERKEAGIARAAAEREARQQKIQEATEVIVAEALAAELEAKRARSRRRALETLSQKALDVDTLGKLPEEKIDQSALAVQFIDGSYPIDRAVVDGYFEQAHAFVKAVMPVM